MPAHSARPGRRVQIVCGRAFSFPDVGPLPEHDAFTVIQEPIRAAGESIEQDALQEIYHMTQGHPYFLQEWGYQAWNHALESPITVPLFDEFMRRAIPDFDV